jgi:hypothetical protein
LQRDVAVTTTNIDHVHAWTYACITQQPLCDRAQDGRLVIEATLLGWRVTQGAGGAPLLRRGEPAGPDRFRCESVHALRFARSVAARLFMIRTPLVLARMPASLL